MQPTAFSILTSDGEVVAASPSEWAAWHVAGHDLLRHDRIGPATITTVYVGLHGRPTWIDFLTQIDGGDLEGRVRLANRLGPALEAHDRFCALLTDMEAERWGGDQSGGRPARNSDPRRRS
jgi:hypothetical protein